MSLIFTPGRYLALIFLFLDIFFPLSPNIVERLKISVVPFLHTSFFCCTELLSVLLILSVVIDWISCSSEYVMVCSTSFTGQFLVLNFRETSCFKGLSITTSKSASDGLLEKSSTALLLTGA